MSVSCFPSHLSQHNTPFFLVGIVAAGAVGNPEEDVDGVVRDDDVVATAAAANDEEDDDDDDDENGDREDNIVVVFQICDDDPV